MPEILVGVRVGIFAAVPNVQGWRSEKEIVPSSISSTSPGLRKKYPHYFISFFQGLYVCVY